MPNCSGQSTAVWCLAHDKNISHHSDIYESFIADWDRFCSASIHIDVYLPLPEASVAILLEKRNEMAQKLSPWIFPEQTGSKTEIGQVWSTVNIIISKL